MQTLSLYGDERHASLGRCATSPTFKQQNMKFIGKFFISRAGMLGLFLYVTIFYALNLIYMRITG
jgi:hypothetical protein